MFKKCPSSLSAVLLYTQSIPCFALNHQPGTDKPPHGDQNHNINQNTNTAYYPLPSIHVPIWPGLPIQPSPITNLNPHELTSIPQHNTPTNSKLQLKRTLKKRTKTANALLGRRTHHLSTLEYLIQTKIQIPPHQLPPPSSPRLHNDRPASHKETQKEKEKEEENHSF